MRRIHVVGRKNHGKTTLIIELIQEFARRGLRVGTVKHSSHAHELDVPGKDSFRQRQAGANPAAIVTDGLIGLYTTNEREGFLYAQLAPMFVDCDLVLVEGHLNCPGPKIEVWREEVGRECLALNGHDIAAVVTDDLPKVSVPLWARHDVARLAQHILDLARSPVRQTEGI